MVACALESGDSDTAGLKSGIWPAFHSRAPACFFISIFIIIIIIIALELICRLVSSGLALAYSLLPVSRHLDSNRKQAPRLMGPETTTTATTTTLSSGVIEEARLCSTTGRLLCLVVVFHFHLTGVFFSAAFFFSFQLPLVPLVS